MPYLDHILSSKTDQTAAGKCHVYDCTLICVKAAIICVLIAAAQKPVSRAGKPLEK